MSVHPDGVHHVVRLDLLHDVHPLGHLAEDGVDAVEVARREGVNRTAAALHLDGGKLKRRMVAADMVAGKASPPAFIEFMAAATAGQAEYTIELEGRNGRLRIHCKGATAANLAELSRALWDVAC